MTHEQILMELLKDYYILKEAYKLEQGESKKYSEWWMDATNTRNELSKEVLELSKELEQLKKTK